VLNAPPARTGRRLSPSQIAGGGAVAIWTLGSCVVLVVIARGLVRLRRLVRHASRADQRTLLLAEQAGAALGLRRTPDIRAVGAEISPMVLCFPRRHTVVLPAHLCAQLTDAQLRTVLAHELCHIRRLDHVWRWLEAAATVLFWWHPCLWWTRSMLRRTEELCCDGHVAALFADHAADYARALIQAASFAQPRLVCAHGAVHLVSEAESLERRIAMIRVRSGFRLTRGLRAAALAAAALALPVSVALAAEPPEGFPSIDEIVHALETGSSNVAVQAFTFGPNGQTPLNISPEQLRGLLNAVGDGNHTITMPNGNVVTTSTFSTTAAFTLGPGGQLTPFDASHLDLQNAINVSDLDNSDLGDLLRNAMANIDVDQLVRRAMANIDLSQAVQNAVAASGQSLPADTPIYTFGPNGQLVHVGGPEVDDATLAQMSQQVGDMDINDIIDQLTRSAGR
jgi:beta-lactamase regulating signal transducer with metallopeptidase domain